MIKVINCLKIRPKLNLTDYFGFAFCQKDGLKNDYDFQNKRIVQVSLNLNYWGDKLPKNNAKTLFEWLFLLCSLPKKMV